MYLKSGPSTWHHCIVSLPHHNAGSPLPSTQAAQDRGLPISVETCAHYLAFSSADIQDKQTLYKCAPPIRDEANRQVLSCGLLLSHIPLISVIPYPSDQCDSQSPAHYCPT